MAAKEIFIWTSFPPNDVLGTCSEISEEKNKGKPGPPAFVKMFCVIHPGLFDSRTGWFFNLHAVLSDPLPTKIRGVKLYNNGILYLGKDSTNPPVRLVWKIQILAKALNTHTGMQLHNNTVYLQTWEAHTEQGPKGSRGLYSEKHNLQHASLNSAILCK